MLTRRAVLASIPLALAPHAFAQQGEGSSRSLGNVLESAASLRPLKAVVISRHGDLLAGRGYHGHSPDSSTNIKSASKSVISALVGIAIDRGLLAGVDQKIAPLLEDKLPRSPDPRLFEIEIGHLLSMQAGLQSLSGPNYGRWVASRDWVRAALEQPFADSPGGAMQYSTASTHLLSAILTRVGRQSTLALAQEWLRPLDGFRIGGWDRDPQGIYLGGNQMAMSTRSLWAFGELYRNGGRSADGTQIVPPQWIDRSWQLRTHSRFSGDGYGYGWFLREIGGEEVRFGWGYGGQMIYIVPSLGLTVAMTSDEAAPSARTGYRNELHDLLARIVKAV